MSFSSLLALLVAGHIPTGLDESVIETATDNGTQETVAEVHEVVRSLKPGIFHDVRLAAAVDGFGAPAPPGPSFLAASSGIPTTSGRDILISIRVSTR